MTRKRIAGGAGWEAHLFGLAGIGSEGLFAQHGFLVLQAEESVGIVVRMWRSDIYQVHLRVFHQGLIRPVSTLQAVCPCKAFRLFPTARAYGKSLGRLHPLQSPGHLLGDVARTQDSYFILFHDSTMVIGTKVGFFGKIFLLLSAEIHACKRRFSDF